MLEGAVSAPAAQAPAPEELPLNVLEIMLSALELQGTERVLCVGRAVGYVAAVLSHLAREVYALEIDEALVEPDTVALARLGRTNVSTLHADGVRGWQPAAPYQAILATAAAPELPPALVEQLADGGRIVIPLGDEHAQLIELLEKHTDVLVSRTLGGCRLPSFPSLKRAPSTFPWASHEQPERRRL